MLEERREDSHNRLLHGWTKQLVERGRPKTFASPQQRKDVSHAAAGELINIKTHSSFLCRDIIFISRKYTLFVKSNQQKIKNVSVRFYSLEKLSKNV